jgi:two-component system, chemotaxis family, chemotaxis protein CheY
MKAANVFGKFISYNLNDLEILLIEKRSSYKSILKSTLEELGASGLISMIDFSEAALFMKQSIPDIIISDWSDDLEALEFLEWVRKGPSSPDHFIPFIIMSNFCSIREVKQARDSGTDEFLARPFSARSLYDRICKIIRVRQVYVRSANYFGPDRRKLVFERYNKIEKRKIPSFGETENSIMDGAGTPVLCQGELDVLLG